MKQKFLIFFLIVVFLLVMIISTAKANTQIDSCGTLSSPDTYELTSNISSTGTCFNITADDVVLDCQDYTIKGGWTGSSIYNDGYDRMTIKNCNIKHFYSAITVNNSYTFRTPFSFSLTNFKTFPCKSFSKSTLS